MVEQELPCGGLLIYQSFAATDEVAVAVGSPKSVLHCFEGENVENRALAKNGKLANILSLGEDALEKDVVLDE